MNTLNKNERDRVLEDKPQQWAINFLNRTFVCKHHFWHCKGEDYQSAKEVAAVYNVPVETVRKCYNNHHAELSQDGVKMFSVNELRFASENDSLTNKTRSLTGFPPKAVVRIGMLLQKGDKPKQLRTSLLETIQSHENRKMKEQKQNKYETMSVKVSPDEKQYYKSLAEQYGMSLAEIQKYAMRKTFPMSEQIKNNEENDVEETDVNDEVILNVEQK